MSAADNRTTREPYETPKLELHGAAADLVQNNFGSGADAGGGGGYSMS